MKRIPIVLSGVALIAAGLTPVALAKPARGTKIQLRKTSFGTILVDGSGATVYMFTRDAKNRDSCVRISGCTDTWPVVKTKGAPVAGKGVRASSLGTITLAHGVRQVTYAGHPLYTYIGDSGPAQTDYIGQQQFGGTWYGVSAAGNAVK